MNDVISSRPMTEANLDAVLKIEYVAFSHPRTRDIFNEGLKNYHCWLIFEGSQQVSHGIIQIILDKAYLLNTMVKPESQGRGLGLCLLEHLMREAAGYQAREYFLGVCAFNQAAHRLHECYGFDEVDRRRDCYSAVGRREDTLVMACTLFD